MDFDSSTHLSFSPSSLSLPPALHRSLLSQPSRQVDSTFTCAFRWHMTFGVVSCLLSFSHHARRAWSLRRRSKIRNLFSIREYANLNEKNNGIPVLHGSNVLNWNLSQPGDKGRDLLFFVRDKLSWVD